MQTPSLSAANMQRIQLILRRLKGSSESTHYLEGDGHVAIQHTVRYSEISPERFRGIWR